MRDMSQTFAQDNRWYRLPQTQALSPAYRPGLVIFCPDRVSAAMVQRHWLESSTRGTGTNPAIIDGEGQVIRAMSPPTTWWESFDLPRHDIALEKIKDVSQMVRSLTSGAYAAVNGVRSWRVFRSIDGSPGVSLHQIADSIGVDTTVAGRLLASMVKEKVITVKAGGYYLDVSGRGLLAYSQRVTPARVLKRWGIYGRQGGEYRRAQRLHNQGQAEAIRVLRKHGYRAYPTMGVVVDYRSAGKLIRIVPDAFVVLPPGVLVAVEFERSAATPEALEKKARNYSRLAEAGHPIPVLFITETVGAAITLAAQTQRYVLAATPGRGCVTVHTEAL